MLFRSVYSDAGKTLLREKAAMDSFYGQRVPGLIKSIPAFCSDAAIFVVTPYTGFATPCRV